jgi:hypothetical protein
VAVTTPRSRASKASTPKKKISSLLHRFLTLLAAERQIPAATLSDVVSFTAHHKDTLRFAVPRVVGHKLDVWAHEQGLHRASARASSTKVGDWTCLHPDAEGEIDVLVYGRSAEVVEALCRAEVGGDPAVAGRLLGYPDCCIAAYAQVSPARWLDDTVARSGAPPFPCWANRLPISWGAPTLIGELYPCSFRCQPAIAIGKRTYQAMRELGLEAIARTTLEQSLRPSHGLEFVQ